MVTLVLTHMRHLKVAFSARGIQKHVAFQQHGHVQKQVFGA